MSGSIEGPSSKIPEERPPTDSTKASGKIEEGIASSGKPRSVYNKIIVDGAAGTTPSKPPKHPRKSRGSLKPYPDRPNPPPPPTPRISPTATASAAPKAAPPPPDYFEIYDRLIDTEPEGLSEKKLLKDIIQLCEVKEYFVTISDNSKSLKATKMLRDFCKVLSEKFDIKLDLTDIKGSATRIYNEHK